MKRARAEPNQACMRGWMKKGGIVIKQNKLDEYRTIVEDIEVLKWKINKLETDLRFEKLLNPEELPEGKGIDNTILLRLEDNIKQLTASLEEKEQAMKSLVMLIDRFKGLDNQILKMKYIDGMPLKEIAEKLIYNYQHIITLHASIIKAITIFE